MPKALREEFLFHFLNPDDDTGRGYGTTITKMDRIGMGRKEWPYDEWDEGEGKYDTDEFGFDELSDIDKMSNKIGNGIQPSDPAGRHAYDRKSFIDGETRGVSEAFRKLIALMVEDAFRLRGASSEPESLGSDSWPGATPPTWSLDPKSKEPAWTFKAVMTPNENSEDDYDGEIDRDNPADMFGFQKRDPKQV